MSVFFGFFSLFLICVILNSLLSLPPSADPWLLPVPFDLPSFMCYIIASVNLLPLALVVLYLFLLKLSVVLVLPLSLLFFRFLFSLKGSYSWLPCFVFTTFGLTQDPSLIMSQAHCAHFCRSMRRFLFCYHQLFWIIDNTLHSQKWLLINF